MDYFQVQEHDATSTMEYEENAIKKKKQMISSERQYSQGYP